MKSSTRSRDPISSSMRMTASFAPPWSGPFKVAMAEVIAECMSASVAAVTRAANVEAFSSWSACRTRAMSKARTASAVGFAPFSIRRKSSAWPSERSGSTSG